MSSEISTDATPRRLEAATPRGAARSGAPATRLRRFQRYAEPRRERRRDQETRRLVHEHPARTSILARERVIRRLLVVSDALTALLALYLVVDLLGDDRVTRASIGALPLIVFINKVAGLYDRDHLVLRRSTLDEVPSLLQLTGLYALGVCLLEPALIDGSLGTAQLATLWMGGFAATVAGRLTVRHVSRRLIPPERCLIVGDAEHVERIQEKIAMGGAHADVVAALPLEVDGQTAFGGETVLRELVDELDLHRIVIAPVDADSADLVHLIRITKAVGVRVSVLPRMFEAVGSSMEFETLDGMTMLGVRPFGLSRSSRLLKRAFDLTGATVGLIAIAPIIACIALAVRIDSRGPVFFRQVRVGRYGRHFRIFKFRTMVPEAEALKADLRRLNEAGDGFFKIAEDPRVTRVGRFLRRTSLDELPQLFNVVLGEMSLVGPRPLVVDEDIQVVGLDRSRLHLTPGMTGPWQVLGSSRIPMQEMVGIDYLYVANWSLWADVKILGRTVEHMVTQRGL